MTDTPTAQDQRLQEISRTLVTARREAGSLPAFPGALPSDLDEAYAVQAISRTAWDDQLIGWKVGGIPPKFQESLGAKYLTGPIYAHRRFEAREGKTNEMPVFAKGFAAIEPEFVLELGKTRAEDRLYIGAEIASSPIVDINGIGPLAVVCDFGNNNGVLVGPEIAGWRERGVISVEVETQINGVCVGTRAVENVADNVDAATDFFLAHAKRNHIEVPVGTLISTGAITGVHDAAVGAVSRLDFGAFGSLDLALVAEQGEA